MVVLPSGAVGGLAFTSHLSFCANGGKRRRLSLIGGQGLAPPPQGCHRGSGEQLAEG